MQIKGKKFEWIEECGDSFRKLKHLFTNAPTLKIENPNKDFVICTYPYKEGIGGVLMQEGQVVCYDSRKLNEHKWNYVTHDLELEASIHALNM